MFLKDLGKTTIIYETTPILATYKFFLLFAKALARQCHKAHYLITHR